MPKGKLVVLEGADGSGKQTQAGILAERLRGEGRRVKEISFPRYGNPMAAPVEGFLRGDLGDIADVNPYAASLPYTVDQWASVRQEWGQAYESGAIVVADRYCTSNVLHQGSRLDGEERDGFIAWLKDLVYGKFEIPEPDIVLYLHLDPDVAERTLASRTGKEGVQHDILERDAAYQRRCRIVALDIAEKEGWRVVQCTEGGALLSMEAIHEKIMAEVRPIIEEETQ